MGKENGYSGFYPTMVQITLKWYLDQWSLVDIGEYTVGDAFAVGTAVDKVLSLSPVMQWGEI